MENYFDINAYPIKNVLSLLLADRSTTNNIIFATDAYADLGYKETDQITEVALQELSRLGRFQPRVSKSKTSQQERTKKNAEVFTPAWVCNMMINHLDYDWFGRENVFNIENGVAWEINNIPISFKGLGKERSWTPYVKSRRLEITCGEAPFLVSRYDAVEGALIPPKNRIGILDRKLRVVNENVKIKEEWQKWVVTAFQNVYGYEYQGDNLLIARLNLLMSYYEYYKEIWGEEPSDEELKTVVDVIVWNIWQMDGLEDSVPLTDEIDNTPQKGWLFAESEMRGYECRQPKYCSVKQWTSKKKHSYLWKERGDMHFDYVIGNPPYQDNSSGDNETFTPPFITFLWIMHTKSLIKSC